jgi:hypothetical protein
MDNNSHLPKNGQMMLFICVMRLLVRKLKYFPSISIESSFGITKGEQVYFNGIKFQYNNIGSHSFLLMTLKEVTPH